MADHRQGRLLPGRAGALQRPGRHRPGPVGHQGQGTRRARVRTPRRPGAGEGPGVPLDRRRQRIRTRRSGAARGGRGLRRREAQPRRAAAAPGHPGRGAHRGGPPRRTARRGRLGRGHRRRLPRPLLHRHGPPHPAPARTSDADVRRGTRPPGILPRPGRPHLRHLDPPRHRRTPLLPLGLPRRPAHRHRGRPARPLARGRDLRGAQDRRAGRGVRRGTGPALPARPDRVRREPPSRLRHAELRHPGTEPRGRTAVAEVCRNP